MSNLKQIGLGMMMYVQDYDGTYPNRCFGTNCENPNNYSATQYKWMDAIYPYVKSEQLFNCPSHSLPYRNPADTAYMRSYKLKDNYNFGSYGCNDVYNGSFANASGNTGLFRQDVFQPVKIATVEAPSTTVAIMDSHAVDNYPWMVDHVTFPAAINTSGSDQYLAGAVERHLDTLNVLWADGHVKSMKLTQLIEKNGSGIATYWTIFADPK